MMKKKRIRQGKTEACEPCARDKDPNLANPCLEEPLPDNHSQLETSYAFFHEKKKMSYLEACSC